MPHTTATNAHPPPMRMSARASTPSGVKQYMARSTQKDGATTQIFNFPMSDAASLWQCIAKSAKGCDPVIAHGMPSSDKTTAVAARAPYRKCASTARSDARTAAPKASVYPPCREYVKSVDDNHQGSSSVRIATIRPAMIAGVDTITVPVVRTVTSGCAMIAT